MGAGPLEADAAGCQEGQGGGPLKPKVEELLASLRHDPLQNPPAFEVLVGDLAGAYSRRINIQDRLVYEVFIKECVVRVLRTWTHYE